METSGQIKLFPPGACENVHNNESGPLYPPESLDQISDHPKLYVEELPKLFPPGGYKNLYVVDTPPPTLYPPESLEQAEMKPKIVLDEEVKLFPPGPSDDNNTNNTNNTHKLKASRENKMFTHLCASSHIINNVNVNNEGFTAMANRPWFYGNEIASIYGFPAPDMSRNVTVGVISFGGGLYGNVDSNGLHTNGDVQAYWTKCGIDTQKQPKVFVVPLFGATNAVDDSGTDENTLDIEMIGCACPSPNLTIILYLAPNSISNFLPLFQYAITTPVNENSIPTILSVSWAASELYDYGSTEDLIKSAADKGINIFVASGDYGSTDASGNVSTCNYPSSSPNVISCGGTNLVCPSLKYDKSTKETTWSGSGGGISKKYSKPSYQSELTGNFRRIPDISLDADPSTGIAVLLNGKYGVYGGTSFVAPLMAGFLAAINVSTFINPLLYSAPKTCFYDILSGSNGTYSAKKGYDDCTGLGSVNGQALSKWLLYPVQPPQDIHVSSISLTPSSVTLENRNSVQLNPTILPLNATNKSVTWISSNKAVCVVTNTGLVTSLAVGRSTITVTSVDSGIKATVVITVTNPKVKKISVSSISISPSSTLLLVNQTYQIKPIFNPSTATDKSLTWSSSNTNIATVCSLGIVKAHSSGSVIISAKSSDGSKTSTLEVLVKQSNVKVSSVSVSESNIRLEVNQTYQINPIIVPENATNKSVIWFSSNTNVAFMSSSGVVTAVSKGSAVITVRTIDGMKNGKVKIQVGPPSSLVMKLFVPPTISSMNTNSARLSHMKVADPDIHTGLVVKSYMKYRKE